MGRRPARRGLRLPSLAGDEASPGCGDPRGPARSAAGPTQCPWAHRVGRAAGAQPVRRPHPARGHPRGRGRPLAGHDHRRRGRTAARAQRVGRDRVHALADPTAAGHAHVLPRRRIRGRCLVAVVVCPRGSVGRLDVLPVRAAAAADELVRRDHGRGCGPRDAPRGADLGARAGRVGGGPAAVVPACLPAPARPRGAPAHRMEPGWVAASGSSDRGRRGSRRAGAGPRCGGRRLGELPRRPSCRSRPRLRLARRSPRALRHPDRPAGRWRAGPARPGRRVRLPPVDDRCPGRAARQHRPPNLALVAYASAQIGLVLLLSGRAGDCSSGPVPGMPSSGATR